MDKQIPTNGNVQPGISMAHGPVTGKDTKMTEVNGAMTNGATPAKRKARESIVRPDYADAESSDDEPMVCAPGNFVAKVIPTDYCNRSRNARPQSNLPRPL